MARLAKLRALLTMVAACALVLLGTSQPAMAAKWFVDAALGDLKPEQKVVPAKPAPVQLLYTFQRDGAANPRATKATKQIVTESVKATGVFSDVVETPVDGGAAINVTINNVTDKQALDKAKSKGFGAGLSFGMFSGVVAVDHYVITFDYVGATGGKPIEATVMHALAMKFGNTADPTGVVQVKSLDEALHMMIRQAVDHGVNTIVTDPGFAHS